MKKVKTLPIVMQKKPVRFYLLSCIILFSSAILFNACSDDDDDDTGPDFTFVTDAGFTYDSDTLQVGETFKVAINATCGSSNITNLLIKVETGIEETYLDSGLNSQNFYFERTFTKGLAATETWSFIIRDKNGNSVQKSIGISLDSTGQFGQITYYPSITLGAQNNTSTGPFYSISNDSVYTLQEAHGDQTNIDLCYFYDDIGTDENTIASPGANIDASVYSGTYGLSNWTTTRTTRYKTASITLADFNAAQNDSLLITLYGSSDGKRKAKNLTQGDFYSFKNEDGKMGVFHVINVSGTDAGTIEIEIKVQQ